MRKLSWMAAAAALFTVTPATAATTIDFESYSGFISSPIVDSGATFSTPSGIFYFADYFANGSQELCPTSGPDCSIQLDVDFASAISGLSFLASADDSASTLSVLITLADLTTTLETFTLDGNVVGYDTIDLSGFGNVLGISISSNDTLGLIYDDFTFSDAITEPVPEPATWLMLLLGFGIMGSALRRRRLTGASLA